MASKYVYVDDCPCPRQLAPILLEIKKETGVSFNSIYRGTDARAMLNAKGKKDQAWLYANLPRGVANPPGVSTHELRNDGVAYKGWRGMPLRFWQCGLDINGSQTFVRAAAKHGFVATITYPTSSAERHHVNFRKEPKLNLRPTLSKGHKNYWNWQLAKKLQYLGYLPKKLGHSPWVFTLQVEKAVMLYQKHHKLVQDGKVGNYTWFQITTSVRNKQQKAK